MIQLKLRVLFYIRLMFFAWSLSFVSCANYQKENTQANFIRSIFVSEPISIILPETTVLSSAIHDTAVKTLKKMNYKVTSQPKDADAILRFIWRTESQKPNTSTKLVLQMILETRIENIQVYDKTNVFSNPKFLNNERASDIVYESLTELGISPFLSKIHSRQ